MSISIMLPIILIIDNIKISTAIMQVLKITIFLLFAQEKQDVALCASSKPLFVPNKNLVTFFSPHSTLIKVLYHTAYSLSTLFYIFLMSHIMYIYSLLFNERLYSEYTPHTPHTAIQNAIKVINTAVQPKLSAITPRPYELIVLPR